MSTARNIGDEIDADNVTVNEKRQVYWVFGDESGSYPDIGGYKNIPHHSGE